MPYSLISSLSTELNCDMFASEKQMVSHMSRHFVLQNKIQTNFLLSLPTPHACSLSPHFLSSSLVLRSSQVCRMLWP